MIAYTQRCSCGKPAGAGLNGVWYCWTCFDLHYEELRPQLEEMAAALRAKDLKESQDAGV